MDEKEEKVVHHLDYWCPFTKLLKEYISKSAQPSVWMLCGKEAQDIAVPVVKCTRDNSATDIEDNPSLIDETKRYVIMGVHPSTRSSGMNNFWWQLLLLRQRVWINWGLMDGYHGKTCEVRSLLYECPEF